MVTPIEPVRVDVYNEVKWIVAVCSFCGRWRDSCHQWITPPTIVEALVDAGIIGLSHTYCVACLREQSQKEPDKRHQKLYSKMADREDTRAKECKGEEYQSGDIVHNLTLGILPSGKEFKQ